MRRGTCEARGVRSVVLYRRASLQLECFAVGMLYLYVQYFGKSWFTGAGRGFPGWESSTQLFVFVWTRS